MNTNDKSFSDALKELCDAINQSYKGEAAKTANLGYSDTDPTAYFKPVQTMEGAKRIRVVSVNGSSRSVVCFVDKDTGDILKAACWNAPAKGARGNIYDPKTFSDIDAHGGWLYR